MVVVPASPAASLGQWNTDHFSHYSSAILFWHRGFRIFRTPVQDLCGRPTEKGLLIPLRLDIPPDQLCELPERKGERPLFINWAELPRPYPPGALLFALPEAMLYAHTSLSFETINRLAIIKDILAGHLLVLVLLEMLLGGPVDETRRRWRSVSVLIGALVYFAVVPWAVAGMFDPIAVVCICWAIARLERDEPVAAIAFLALAAFLHFRTVWYLPLGIFALLRLRTQRSELRTRKGMALLACAGVLLALASATLVLVAPYLGRFPATSPVVFPHLVALGANQINFLVIAALACGYLGWQRDYLLLALLGWQVIVIVLTPQAQAWHGMFLLPLLAVARWRRSSPMSIAMIVLVIVAFTRILYLGSSMPGPFLAQLINKNL